MGSNEVEIVKIIGEDDYVTLGLDQAAARAVRDSAPKPSFLLTLKKPEGHLKAMLPTLPEAHAGSSQPYPAKPAIAKHSIDPDRRGSHVLHDGDTAMVVMDPTLGQHLKPHQVREERWVVSPVRFASARVLSLTRKVGGSRWTAFGSCSAR